MCWEDSFEDQWAIWRFQEMAYPAVKLGIAERREANAAVAAAIALLKRRRLGPPINPLAPLAAWLGHRRAIRTRDVENRPEVTVQH